MVKCKSSIIKVIKSQSLPAAVFVRVSVASGVEPCALFVHISGMFPQNNDGRAHTYTHKPLHERRETRCRSCEEKSQRGIQALPLTQPELCSPAFQSTTVVRAARV
ncbi:hypothetical protein JOB18_029711 [Solea senegalensis]|uniref:Uncharacterized protein n=1 Tax=Solea senegalensis TaxID=28829 RepID=A0AAV6T828_SOLSE|nr:hypothetical protein JOB18_029711 [Solea senegalensis]